MATPLVLSCVSQNQRLDDIFLKGMQTRLSWNPKTCTWKIITNPQKLIRFYISIYGLIGSLLLLPSTILLGINFAFSLKLLSLVNIITFSFLVFFGSFLYLFDFLVWKYGQEIVEAVNYLLHANLNTSWSKYFTRNDKRNSWYKGKDNQ